MQRDEWKKPEQQEKLQEKMLKIFWLKSSLCVERASAAVIVPSYRSYSLSVCSCNYRYYSGILITVSNTAVSSTSTADLSRLCTAPALFRSLSTHTHTHTHTHARTHICLWAQPTSSCSRRAYQEGCKVNVKLPIVSCCETFTPCSGRVLDVFWVHLLVSLQLMSVCVFSSRRLPDLNYCNIIRIINNPDQQN